LRELGQGKVLSRIGGGSKIHINVPTLHWGIGVEMTSNLFSLIL
jgi:hypothetical protein